jgi:hypothetical protein
MRNRFSSFVSIGPSLYRAGAMNDDPRLPYKEYTTRPHPPPYKAGTPLYRWALRHRINPKYVADLIAARGTKGAYIMERILEEMGEEFQRSLIIVVSRTINAV